MYIFFAGGTSSPKTFKKNRCFFLVIFKVTLDIVLRGREGRRSYSKSFAVVLKYFLKGFELHCGCMFFLNLLKTNVT